MLVSVTEDRARQAASMTFSLTKRWKRERQERRFKLEVIVLVFFSPQPEGFGAYNLVSVRPSVRPSARLSVRPYVSTYHRTYVRTHTSVDSDFSEVYGSNYSLKLYTKIRNGLRIVHVKFLISF